jgi:hypothetical protein
LYASPTAKERAAPKWRDSRKLALRRASDARYTPWMNENFGELKARFRKLNELLTSDDGKILENLDFARAVSQAHRLLRDGDRTREPSPAVRTAVEKAEVLGRAIRAR